MTFAVESARRTEHAIEGATISIMRGGSGVPLLFLHGSDAFTAWLPFMDELAQEYDVIVPDHPGFGRSDTPPWLDVIDDLVHTYEILIEDLGLKDVIVAGHGIGGWIACSLALRNPRAFRALIVVDSAGLPLAVDGIDTFMCSPDEFRQAAFVDVSRAPHLDRVDREGIAKNALMTARLAWQPRFYDPQLAKWLHRLALPTLIVWGQDDAIFPVAQAHNFARTIVGARVAIVPDAGHLPHVEAPHAFALAVRAFMRIGDS